MKTSDILLFSIIGLGVYEFVLKPKTTPQIVRPIATGLPTANSPVSAVASLLTSLGKAFQHTTPANNPYNYGTTVSSGGGDYSNYDSGSGGAIDPITGGQVYNGGAGDVIESGGSTDVFNPNDYFNPLS